MNWADWIIVAIIAISCVFSLWRGFVKEALSLVTWLAAFMLARTFVAPMETLLLPYIETPSLRIGSAFALIFVVTLIFGALVSKLVTSLVDATGLTATDRMLGIAFGAVRGGVVVILLLMLAKQTPAVEDVWWKESTLIPHFSLFENWTKQIAGDLSDIIW